MGRLSGPTSDSAEGFSSGPSHLDTTLDALPTRVADVSQIQPLLDETRLVEHISSSTQDGEFFEPPDRPAKTKGRLAELLQRVTDGWSLQRWILVGVLVGALAGLMLTEVKTAPAQASAGVVSALVSATHRPATPIAPVTPEAAPALATANSLDIKTLEMRGAAALAGGDYPQALTNYRALAAAHPGNTTWASTVRILEQRLQSSAR